MYLRDLLLKYENDPPPGFEGRRGLYNAGPGAVDKLQGHSAFRETYSVRESVVA